MIALVVVAVLSACSSPQQPSATGPDTANKPALYYAKGGSIYVSEPAGAPARKLTDGPADTEPAPSPDGSRLAFVRKANREAAGGELWVLDLSTGGAPASVPHRLVDPGSLVPVFDGEDPAVLDSPSWSPAGDRIAFLKTGANGGFLLTADAETGVVGAPRQPLYADRHYDWSPDGRQIVWTGGRSDVSPVDVNVLTIGESSNPIVSGVNATSVAFDAERRTVVFSNSDATESLFAAIPFKLRAGGIYSLQPPADPAPLFSGTGSYTDIAVLWGGKIGFTQWSQDQRTKSVQVLAPGGTPRNVAETRSDSPGPRWVGETVAYIGTGEDRPLLIQTVREHEEPQRIDSDVDAFAWGD